MLNTPIEISSEPSLQSMLTRYALRYYISGRERDHLVEMTARALACDPDAILDTPVEKAIAEAMHRIFLDGVTHAVPRAPKGPEKRTSNA